MISKRSASPQPYEKTSPAAASTAMGEEGDDEDYGALIYRESQLRKAEAAAAAAAKGDAKKKKKNSSVDVSSTRRRATSTRATSAGNAKSRKSSVNAAQ